MTTPEFNLKRLAVAELVCHDQNPRLVEEPPSPRDAIRAVFRADPGKELDLAEDIAANGLSPFELLYVGERVDGTYVVFEGNRRTAAMKALHSPEIVSDLLNPGQRKRLAKAKKGPRVPAVVMAAVATDKATIDLWIQRRHTGEQKGLGLVRWGPLQVARYRSRALGECDETLLVLELVIAHGTLEQSFLDSLDTSFNFTNLQRFVESPLPRRYLGLDLARDEEGKRILQLLGPTDEVVPAWEEIVRRICGHSGMVTGKLKVQEIKTVELMLGYIRALGDDLLPDPEKMEEEYRDEVLSAVREKLGVEAEDTEGGDGADDKGTDESGGDDGGGGESGSGDDSKYDSDEGGDSEDDAGSTDDKKPAPKHRRKIVPPSLSLSVRPARVAEIFGELQKLPVWKYRNATAVLFRVFMELSADVLQEEEAIFTKPHPSAKDWDDHSLKFKLDTAIKWLEKEGHLGKDGATAARKAFSATPLQESSIMILNGFVHNKHMFPDKEGLKTAWDTVQPFLVALWNTRPKPAGV